MTDFLYSSLKIISLNVRGIRDNLFSRRKNADLIFLQETHSVDDDVKFWKAQWGDTCYFCHASQQSAGVAILLNKFKGDIIESMTSNEGRWIILVLKLDNSFFIVCNLYNYNNTAQAKIMFLQLCLKLEAFKNKYKEAHLIIGGDYNDAPDDLVDRVPVRLTPHSRFKSTAYICEQLAIIDVWRFLNPDINEFTWSNVSRSSQSRIDLWLISPSCLQFVAESSHNYAPFSDHKLISIHLAGTKQQNGNIRGYWKLNNNLLKDKEFCDLVKKTAKSIFDNKDVNHIQKWEFFKFKIREIAIKRSKAIKKKNIAKELSIMNNLNILMMKNNLSEEEETIMKKLKEEIDDMYIDMAKGAFVRSRAKWLEQGEKNSSYFFALEKRNRKRNNLTTLKIDNNIISNSLDISRYVGTFYSNIYKSNIQFIECDNFIESVKAFTPTISEQFKLNCDCPIT